MLKKVLSKLGISRLQWHDLKSVKPVSREFGFDRGTPIDRYYIEKFLGENCEHVTGTVLEVAESHYSRAFGQGVIRYEVLHVEKTGSATIVGDLSAPGTLPESVVDCFIATQTFNFIFDFQKAIEGAHRLLKPGGVLLATVGGISPISRYDADRWGHYWSFYPQGIEKAMQRVFGDNQVTIKTFGNSLSAISFVKGIALDELTSDELDYHDQDYPVTIGIIAKKV